MADDELRSHLVKSYEDLSIGYARTLVTLAGGALGLSLTFSQNFVGPTDTCRTLLVAAWAFWSIALTLVLLGYFAGRESAYKARQQIDSGELERDPELKFGGYWRTATQWAGGLSLLAFVAGVAVFIIYMTINLGADSGDGRFFIW